MRIFDQNSVRCAKTKPADYLKSNFAMKRSTTWKIPWSSWTDLSDGRTFVLLLIKLLRLLSPRVVAGHPLTSWCYSRFWFYKGCKTFRMIIPSTRFLTVKVFAKSWTLIPMCRYQMPRPSGTIVSNWKSTMSFMRSFLCSMITFRMQPWCWKIVPSLMLQSYRFQDSATPGMRASRFEKALSQKTGRINQINLNKRNWMQIG